MVLKKLKQVFNRYQCALGNFNVIDKELYLSNFTMKVKFSIKKQSAVRK